MYEDAMRAIQLCLQWIIRNDPVSLLSGAGDDHCRTVCRTIFSDQVILGIGNDHVVIEVNAKIFRAIQSPLSSGFGMRGIIGSNQSSELTILIEHAKRIAAPLQNIDVPFGIYGSSAWIYEWTFGCDRSISRNTFLTITGDCGHDA